VIGPSGRFVIDSKQWTGSVHQGADGLVWHNHYRLDRTLETVRWEAQTLGRLLGTRTHPCYASTAPTSKAAACRPGAWRSCPPTCCAARWAMTGCCRTPRSSCWLPLPACGCGRPPDVCRIAVVSAMVGDVDPARPRRREEVPAASPRWRAGRGFFERNQVTRRAAGG
jgi:hypothetical protein